VVVGWRL